MLNAIFNAPGDDADILSRKAVVPQYLFDLVLRN